MHRQTALALLLLLAASTHARAAGGPISLGTARTEVVIDRDTGIVTSIKDRVTGREWLAPDGGKRLYQIELARPGQEPLKLDFTTATQVKTRRNVEGAQITAESHGDVQLGVRIDFSGGPTWSTLLCRISIRNGTGLAIQSVRFPVLTFPVRLGEDAADDRVLLPYCDGIEIENPEVNLQGLRAAQYPGASSMQFIADYDREGGLFAAALDSEGSRKQIGVSRSGNTLEPVLTHYPLIEGLREWTLPYPVVIEAFSGDWQTAATLYRAWAEAQPWCRTPLRKRKDIPAWLFQPAFYYAVSLRGTLPDGTQGERLAPVAEQVAAYHKQLGVPVVGMLMSWEQHGGWVTPDYFPPVGGTERFKELTSTLHQQGDRALVFLSGLKWTLHKSRDGITYDDEADFKQQGEKWAICGPDGQPQRFGKPDAGVGENAEICPATPFAREMLSAAVSQCQALGIDAVQVDQIVGGGTPPCYSKEHGHLPRSGSARAVYALLERLRREGRERNKEFALLIEEPGEYFIPVLDAYHARDYAEGRWPRSGPGVRGVPLFTYVYHEYCLGYGGDSAPLGPWGDRFNAYQHALNLVHGKVPAGAVWTRWQPPSGIHVDQLSVLRGAIALLNSPASEFLLKGKRLSNPAGRTEPLTLSLAPEGRKEPEKREYPRVLQAPYMLPGGRIGRILINMGDQRERVEIPIAAFGLPGQRLGLTLYQVEGDKVTQQKETIFTPCVYPISLAPMAPAFLESAPAGWETPG